MLTLNETGIIDKWEKDRNCAIIVGEENNVFI